MALHFAHENQTPVFPGLRAPAYPEKGVILPRFAVGSVKLGLSHHAQQCGYKGIMPDSNGFCGGNAQEP